MVFKPVGVDENGHFPPRVQAALAVDFQSKLPATARLFAALALRNTTPCRIAFVGSSTTEGVGASTATERWVNKFVTMLQAAYPASGNELPVIYSNSATWGVLSNNPGVQAYNAAQGGTASDNYLIDSEMASINTLNPSAIFHMIGSNDFDLGYTPEYYKSQVQAKIDKLKSYGNSKPCVHILIQSYERFDKTTHTYTWAQYGKAMKEIADADPSNVVYIDLAASFNAVGIPGSDPLDLIASDSTHPNNFGHSFLADLVRRALGVSVRNNPSTSTVTRTTARFTSDTASGANTGDIIGRNSDALLGGNAKAWTGDPATSVAISGNAFVRGATVNNFTALLAEPFVDVEFSVTLGAMPTGSDINIEIHRQSITVAAAGNCYRALISPSGSITLAKRISGVVTNLASGATCAVGDRVAIRYYKGIVSVLVNGQIVLSVADNSVPAAGYAGFSGTASLTAFNLDNVALDIIT